MYAYLQGDFEVCRYGLDSLRDMSPRLITKPSSLTRLKNVALEICTISAAFVQSPIQTPCGFEIDFLKTRLAFGQRLLRLRLRFRPILCDFHGLSRLQ